jgi:hypothetical protein
MQSSYAHATRRSDSQSASDSRRSRVVLSMAAAALLRPGWLGRLVHAVAEPGGIPPGRSRPEPSGPRR